MIFFPLLITRQVCLLLHFQFSLVLEVLVSRIRGRQGEERGVEEKKQNRHQSQIVYRNLGNTETIPGFQESRRSDSCNKGNRKKKVTEIGMQGTK